MENGRMDDTHDFGLDWKREEEAGKRSEGMECTPTDVEGKVRSRPPTCFVIQQ